MPKGKKKGKQKQRLQELPAGSISEPAVPARDGIVLDNGALDLHGLTAAAALVAVRAHLAANMGGTVQIVSGQGTHSVGGVSVIKERVAEALDSVQMPYRWERGVFTVRVPGVAESGRLGWLGGPAVSADTAAAERAPTIQMAVAGAAGAAGGSGAEGSRQRLALHRDGGAAFPTLDAAAQLALTPAEVALRLSKLEAVEAALPEVDSPTTREVMRLSKVQADMEHAAATQAEERTQQVLRLSAREAEEREEADRWREAAEVAALEAKLAARLTPQRTGGGGGGVGEMDVDSSGSDDFGEADSDEVAQDMADDGGFEADERWRRTLVELMGAHIILCSVRALSACRAPLTTMSIGGCHRSAGASWSSVPPFCVVGMGFAEGLAETALQAAGGCVTRNSH